MSVEFELHIVNNSQKITKLLFHLQNATIKK